MPSLHYSFSFFPASYSCAAGHNSYDDGAGRCGDGAAGLCSAAAQRWPRQFLLIPTRCCSTILAFMSPCSWQEVRQKKILDDPSLVLYFVECNQFNLACKLGRMASNRFCEQNWQCRYQGLYHLILGFQPGQGIVRYLCICALYSSPARKYRYHCYIMYIIFISKF